MTTFNSTLEKVISIGAKSSNLKSSIKTKLLSKEDKQYIEKNFKKFHDKLHEKELKVYMSNQFQANKKIADSFGISVKKYLSLRKKANELAKCFNAGYSMGGVIEIDVRKGKTYQTFGKYENCYEYAKSSRYKATHGYNSVTLTLKQLEQIEIIGGIPTIKLETSKISKCLTLIGRGSKNNYTIQFKEGYITGNYHGDTIEECQNWRQRQYLQRLKERNPLLHSQEMEKRKQQALNRFVGYNHSRKAGNCHEGTLAFAQRHQLNKNFGYRLGYLVELEPTSQFVQRLFNNFI